ncbi:MAG TPA: hypothetical protein VL098_01805 [Flavipsychrobacter sp.]|nr:hypothetical protein [Flavipsychrobacter sp.]
MNLYVSNLSLETTERDLEKIFSEFGAIKSLKVIIDRETGMSKGYGFVEMEDKYIARDAVDYLDMSFLKGNIINVREAKNNTTGTVQREKRPTFQNKRPFQPRDGQKSSYPRRRSDDFNNDLSYNA